MFIMTEKCRSQSYQRFSSNGASNQCPLNHGQSKLYLDYRQINKGDFGLWRCLTCQMLYTDPLPSKTALAEFYQTYDSVGQKDNYYRHLKNYRRTADGRALEKLFLKLARQFTFNKSLPLLDLGSGGGAFLDIISRHGYRAQGMEISRPAVDFAKNNFGVDCQAGDVAEADFPAGKFGVIFMWDILEHLPEQVKIIQQVNRWLALDGYLIIETPNSQALINGFILGVLKLSIRWPAEWMFGLHHLFWHSQKSLMALLIQNGLTTIKVIKKNTPAGRIFPLSFKNFFSWATLVRLNALANFLGKQNKLLIIAQKK